MSRSLDVDYIRAFTQLGLADIDTVGGKNASLGEMCQKLASEGITIPDGFATVSQAYRDFLSHNNLIPALDKLLNKLEREGYSNLPAIGGQIRRAILEAELPKPLIAALSRGYDLLSSKYGPEISLAVRSSATAEDLPHASFAGQQETYLNVSSKSALETACQRCFASLFTDRAIKYREDMGFNHLKVALSVGVQIMIRADEGCSGVIFTLDPDTGFDQVIHLAGTWGLGENMVQGNVNPDEFYIFKPTLATGKQAIIQRKLGTKTKTMLFAPAPDTGVINIDTPHEKRIAYVLTDNEVLQLAAWALTIETHYQRPMDIEWAKDGLSGELFVLQARPETIYSQSKGSPVITEYKLLQSGDVICSGSGLGNKIAKGRAKVLSSPQEGHKLQSGDILVTPITNPDWDPILRKVGAIITDQGGRTSHAAIVAREMGTVAIVGTGNASELLNDGREITVSCAQGNTGYVFDGLLEWEETHIDPGKLETPKTKPMLILGDPQQAFKFARYPVQGVGLMRLEFTINNSIGVHPMALKYFDQVKDQQTRQHIESLCQGYPTKEKYFIHKLAEGIAMIAAAFYPKEAIVRMSDFKSNEYANLLGGQYFEPKESNPMLGFRGASRYYHEKYQAGFAMECMAIRLARESMGLTNIKVMIPFCRTLKEAEKVIRIMEEHGLKRDKGLEVYMMVEIPSNIILAKEFAAYFDGFSIGSNDLTQLTLGVDRDSELLSHIFDVNDPAVRKMISMLIKSAHDCNIPVGLCGQAPSDYPEFAQFLVELGIDSISFNPDALLKGIENINSAEKRVKLGVIES